MFAFNRSHLSMYRDSSVHVHTRNKTAVTIDIKRGVGQCCCFVICAWMLQLDIGSQDRAPSTQDKVASLLFFWDWN